MNTATAFQTMPTVEVVEQPKETALAVIPEERALEVFLEGKGIDELLAACEEKATAITADVSTAKGRAEIKSMAYLVTRTKTAIDAVRKAMDRKPEGQQQPAQTTSAQGYDENHRFPTDASGLDDAPF